MTYQELIQPVLWAASAGAAVTYVARGLLAKRRLKSEAAERPPIEEGVAWYPSVGRARPLFLRAAIAVAVALVVVPAIGVVPPGHRGVVYNLDGGVSPAERGEGVTLLVPWVQHMTITDTRTQKVYSDKVFAQSSDLQEITVVASVNFHIDPAQAAELYRGVGPSYQSTIVQPALFQRTKAAVGQVRAIDFAQQRDALALTIQRQLTSQLASHGIVIEYVNIEDAIFDPQFVKAVKDKIIAVQVAAQQQRLIAAKEAIKQQTIIGAQARARSVLIEATAQAEANRLLARSLSPDLLTWRWITTWNGIVPTTLVGDASKLMLLLSQGSGYGGSGSYYGG